MLCAVSCARAPALSHEKAKGMIASSAAFLEPVEAEIRKALSYEQGTLKREILRVEALTVKPDGPLGMAGETATVVFTWRWTAGPLAAAEYRTTAKFHGDGRGWTVYEDKLKHNLRETLKGE
jgi:hypothetical protein